MCIAVAALAVARVAAADSILFIGNSFTYGGLSPVEKFEPGSVTDLNRGGVGGVPAVFKAFADEAGLHFDVSLETVPSTGLEFHLERKRDVVAGRWDHVVLQSYSTLDSAQPGNAEKLVDSVGRLTQMFRERNPRVDVRLVSTWSRADQTYLPGGHWYGKPIEAMAMDLRAAYDEAAARSGHVRAVIPVGEAWLEAIHSGVALADPYHPDAASRLNLWASDGYHASTAGYYLEALVIFGSVTGRAPTSLGADEHAAHALGLSPRTVGELEQVAARTLAASRAEKH